MPDCHAGFVVDGLETLFSTSPMSASVSLLRALNNRKYIYFVALKMDYNVLKEEEKKAQEEKGIVHSMLRVDDDVSSLVVCVAYMFALLRVIERQQKEKDEADKRRLEEMSEDEYDALSEEEKAKVDQKRLAIKKERLKRYL